MTQSDLIAQSRSARIKHLANALGFQYCGISEAAFLEEEAPRLEHWLKNGKHGSMGYMERHFDKRLDPRLLVPGAKSVISLLFNYHNPDKPATEEDFKVSQYAYGEDYHHVLKAKLFELMHRIQEEMGQINGRVFVDSAPVMDKAWAKKSGLGWIGKNSNLITRKQGSWFFIAECILDLELTPDGPIKDYCGSCNRCIEACPTEAISPYTVDGSRCISYLTIELRDAIPETFRNKMDNWIFGCDICQEVCPWNRFAQRHSEPAFEPPTAFLEMDRNDWIELTQEIFEQVWSKSPMQRAGFEGLKRTLRFVNGD
jgi:epoxyqueuosine reductase